MQLILTPAGGGQPVTLGITGSSQQGALNLAPLLSSYQPTDVLLVVRNGALAGIQVSVLLAQFAATLNDILME